MCHQMNGSQHFRKKCSAYVFKDQTIHEELQIGLHDPDDEHTTFLQNVRNHSMKDPALHPNTFKSSASILSLDSRRIQNQLHEFGGISLLQDGT